ncbi:30S ribosomal protein S2 [bacterium]|nr:30S ribosomal protein S2 [bacterium]
MALISLRQLLECGVHFGHPTRKWCPKMARFIYTKRNGIHILDLQQTTKFIDEVHGYVHDLVSQGKSILFVGTKKQAQDAIREEATKCGMPYICQRWPGGLLTNRQTMRKRIERLRELRKQKDEGYFEELTKKDAKFLSDELAKLEKNFGGVADLEGSPDALFIVDVKKEVNAVSEAKKLGIPIIGILDTNCDPEDVDYKLPGNDDAIRSIRLFCQIIADSVMEAKYGYLPPDSVFIRAAEEEDEATEDQAALGTDKPAAPAPAEAPVEAPVETAKLELGGATVEVETTAAPPVLTPQPAEVQPADEPPAADPEETDPEVD